MGRWAVVIVSVLVGCREPGSTLPLSAADAGGADGTSMPLGSPRAEPTPPTPPRATNLTPCPGGWLVEARGDGSVCVPSGIADAAPCLGAAARLPGDARCEPVGVSCPSGGS